MSQPERLPDLGGTYHVLRVVSDRKRSMTLAALDAASGEPRFVKVASEAVCADAAALRVFRNEPPMLRRIQREAGPGVVVPVMGEGAWQGRPYFAQPWLEGIRLSGAMRRRPVFDAASTLGAVGKNLEQLKALHAAGFVHGDISPENILIVTDDPEARSRAEAGRLPVDGRVQLVDYELARRVDGPERSATPKNHL